MNNTAHIVKQGQPNGGQILLVQYFMSQSPLPRLHIPYHFIQSVISNRVEGQRLRWSRRTNNKGATEYGLVVDYRHAFYTVFDFQLETCITLLNYTPFHRQESGAWPKHEVCAMEQQNKDRRSRRSFTSSSGLHFPYLKTVLQGKNTNLNLCTEARNYSEVRKQRLQHHTRACQMQGNRWHTKPEHHMSRAACIALH